MEISRDVWTSVSGMASRQPNRDAVTEINYGGAQGRTARTLTYGQLNAHNSAFSASLLDAEVPEGSVLLLFNTGADFVVALLGCMGAGLTAVPAPPPRQPLHRISARLARLVEDAGVTCVVASPEVDRAQTQSLVPALKKCRWLTGDCSGQESLSTRIGPAADAVAYLQYTSGSTSQPKGVAVTHENILNQVAGLNERFMHRADSIFASWLPVFHDMGLIYCVLAPLLIGAHTVLMHPYDFVSSPNRWLELLSDYRATHTIAPNFGFEVCLRKASSSPSNQLDLSHLKVAINASEPVRLSTVDAFMEKFSASAGLSPGVLCPAYGLAEATLIVTSTTPGEKIVTSRPGPAPNVLEEATSGLPSVCCGRPLRGTDVKVVHPTHLQEVDDGVVGEIWVAGSGVSPGYWRLAPDAVDSFGATLTGEERRFLRTGDLGFIAGGALFVNGRIKDTIIVRGQNYYPQDLEQLCESEVGSLRNGCGAVVDLRLTGEVQLGLLYEVRGEADEQRLQRFATEVRAVLSETAGLALFAVGFLPPGEIPKTSSGKIQRSLCRARLREGVAGPDPLLFLSCLGCAGATACELHGNAEKQRIPLAEAQSLTVSVQTLLSSIVGVPGQTIQPNLPFASYGLDSRGAHAFAHALHETLAIEVTALDLYSYPTVNGLVEWLAGR